MAQLVNRRGFLKTAAAASLALGAKQNALPQSGTGNQLIWANLLHLSFNMWEDHLVPEREMRYYRPFLRFDETLWNELLQKMANSGMNMVVIDLGDGVNYTSHPEIAVRDAWHIRKLQAELQKCRDLGLEPIPKLNFSATHDAWLGTYQRQLSTTTYYNVCRELIAEVTGLFDTPRFFHLGMDEETASHQRNYNFVAVRQGELWWHDLLFLAGEVQKNGARPWIWSDYFWNHPDQFTEKMPVNVLQSNWYYGKKLNPKEPRVNAYIQLDKKGFDQLPTASNHSNSTNFEETVRFGKTYLEPEHLLGYLQTPWRPTLPEYRQHHYQAIEQVSEAKKKYYSNQI